MNFKFGFKSLDRVRPSNVSRQVIPYEKTLLPADSFKTLGMDRQGPWYQGGNSTGWRIRFKEINFFRH